MSKRPRMLASDIWEIIAPILRECPEECKVTSITEIDVSEDMSIATVYISALEKPEVAVEFLESRAKELQKKLTSLHRRRIPKLRFRVDEIIEKANRIDEMLD